MLNICKAVFAGQKIKLTSSIILSTSFCLVTSIFFAISAGPNKKLIIIITKLIKIKG